MNAEITSSDSDVEALVERMRMVRATGYDHASELHGEAKRLVDWTEYVRAKPFVSIAVASLLGFSIVRSAMRVVCEPSSPVLAAKSSPNATRSIRSTLASGLVTLATSIASSAIKNYFATHAQRRIREEGSDDRFRNFNSKDQQVS